MDYYFADTDFAVEVMFDEVFDANAWYLDNLLVSLCHCGKVATDLTADMEWRCEAHL